MAKGISGSTIKSWFQYRCERKTRYEIMGPADLAAVPVAKDDREQSWAILGIDYENRVMGRLARETGVLRPGTGDDGLSEKAAVGFLRGEGTAEYAAQMNLRPRKRPLFLSDMPDLSLRRSFADLIRRDISGGAPAFRIIDIKATRGARAFHKTQVAFYARLLEAGLAELGTKGRVEPVGEIWHIPNEGRAEGDAWTSDLFELGPYLRLVDNFCSEILPAIAGTKVEPGRDETFFHLYFKCEQCAYLSHCGQSVDVTRPASNRDISAVAGLTHEAKRALRAIGIRTVGQLADAGAGIGRMDGAGWSLSRRAEMLLLRARALRDGEVQPGAEPHTFLMPARSDAALYLIADHDPVDDGLVTLGYLFVNRGEVKEHIEVLPSPDRSAEADALVRVFTQIIADLARIDAQNAALSATGSGVDGIHAHIFLYEPSEAIAIQNAVGRHLDDSRVRDGLLHMVRLFPPEDLVPEPEFRGMQHLPATALRSVVEQLFALPVTVSYDLRQVSEALAIGGLIPLPYQPAQDFKRPFSSLLSIEISRGLREGRRRVPDAAAVREDVAARLHTIRAIAEWLQAEHRRHIEAGRLPLLRLNKQPFRFQATFNPLAAGDLDVLRAFELLENRSGLLEKLIRLCQPSRVRRDAGRAVGPMRLLSATPKQRDTLLIFAVPPEAQDTDISVGAFGLILSDGEPDLVLEPRLWPRLACDLRESRPGDASNILRVTVRRHVFDGDQFQEVMRRAGQGGWWLDQTFVDLNAGKADAYLTFLAEVAA